MGGYNFLNNPNYSEDEWEVDGEEAATDTEETALIEAAAEEVPAEDPAAAEEAAAEADRQAHAAEATEAQAHADAAIASGDYEAAEAERAQAEDQAWQAGDSSMLHGSNSAELDNAAWQQDWADHYEKQEGEHAAAGDYEAAREDAANAANAQGWADFKAGGEDHGGQAREEMNQMDWAIYEEGRAKDDVVEAEWHAEHGNPDTAANYLDSAAEHQAEADRHGDLGTHGGEFAIEDPSSEVAEGTPVDNHDPSADAGYVTAADSGYDAGYDSGASYDSGADAAYDSGGSYDAGADASYDAGAGYDAGADTAADTSSEY